MSDGLAFSVLQEHATKHELDTMEQLIITCEFISSLDKANELEEYLKNKEENFTGNKFLEN